MLHALYSLLYGSTPATFASSYNLQESIERLRATTEVAEGTFSFRGTIGGTVSENYVSLRRVIPSNRNAFNLYFIGRFERTDTGSTVLSGNFSMNDAIKIFMTLALGLVFLWIIGSVIYIFMLHLPDYWYFPFFGIGIFFLMIGVIKVGKSSTSGDEAWLSKNITAALTSQRN
jgi:hypothetical protein